MSDNQKIILVKYPIMDTLEVTALRMQMFIVTVMMRRRRVVMRFMIALRIPITHVNMMLEMRMMITLMIMMIIVMMIMIKMIVIMMHGGFNCCLSKQYNDCYIKN